MPARAVQAALIGGVVVLVAIGWMVATTFLTPPLPTPSFTVRIPPIGQVAAARLQDGHPVFVVHHQTGEITLLDAFSTFVPYGIFKMVAWCPEARIFDDFADGSRYNEWGAHVAGPAPTGMVVLDWRMGSGGLVNVGGRLGVAQGGDSANPPRLDLAGCRWVQHGFEGDQLTPAQAAAQPEGSWVVVAGVLDPASRRLCALAAGCINAAPIDGLVLPPQLTQRDIDYLTDPRLRRWLAVVSDGRLAHLTRIPDLDAT
jgi:hypothetical protein